MLYKLEASTSLSLLHPNLIDWLGQHQRPEIPSSQNDYEISCYLNAIEPMTSSTSESVVNMMESNIKYLSHNIKRKNKWLDGKNHFVAISKPKKSKNKDVSNGENLLEALTDEVLSSFPSYFQDRSSVLIEATQPFNLGTGESPEIIHVAQSLTTEEKESFSKFFQYKKINFAWTYSNMP